MTVVWHHHAAAASSHKPPVKGIVFWFLIALVVLGIVSCLGFFSFSGWRHASAALWFARLPLPVARLHGRIGWYSDVAKLARGIAVSAEREEPIEQDYLDALDLVSRRLEIARLASKFDVDVSDDDVIAATTDDVDLQTFLAGAAWDMDDYRSLVIRPFVVSQKLDVALDADRSYQDASLASMAALQEKLALGIAFEDIAQQYSEDESAKTKGNLGYLLSSEVDPGLASVFALSTGETSDILEAAGAFWIIRVEDIVHEEDGDRYLLRGIAVNKQTVSAVVDDMLATDPPTLFVHTP